MSEESKSEATDKPKKKKAGVISNIAFIIFIILVYNKWKGSDSPEKQFQSKNKDFILKLNETLKRAMIIKKNHMDKNLAEHETHFAMMTIYADHVENCKIKPTYTGEKKEILKYINSMKSLCDSYKRSSTYLNTKKVDEYLKQLPSETKLTSAFLDSYKSLK